MEGVTMNNNGKDGRFRLAIVGNADESMNSVKGKAQVEMINEIKTVIYDVWSEHYRKNGHQGIVLVTTREHQGIGVPQLVRTMFNAGHFSRSELITHPFDNSIEVARLPTESETEHRHRQSLARYTERNMRLVNDCDSLHYIFNDWCPLCGKPGLWFDDPEYGLRCSVCWYSQKNYYQLYAFAYNQLLLPTSTRISYPYNEARDWFRDYCKRQKKKDQQRLRILTGRKGPGRPSKVEQILADAAQTKFTIEDGETVKELRAEIMRLQEVVAEKEVIIASHGKGDNAARRGILDLERETNALRGVIRDREELIGVKDNQIKELTEQLRDLMKVAADNVNMSVQDFMAAYEQSKKGTPYD